MCLNMIQSIINHIHFQAQALPSQSSASPQETHTSAFSQRNTVLQHFTSSYISQLANWAQTISPQLTKMWTLLVAVAILANCCCEPLPDANQEFDRLLSLAASGNLTPSANVPNYAPYTRQTLLDKYLENPGKLIKFLAYFV